MKFILPALLMLLMAAQVQAQCANSQVVAEDLGPFTGYSSTIMAGGETYFAFDMTNNNPTSCPAITACITSFLNTFGEVGEPTPNGTQVSPPPGNTAGCATLNSCGNGTCTALVLVHFVTNYTGYPTPPHKYHMKTQEKVGANVVNTFVDTVNVIDAWGNTCQP